MSMLDHVAPALSARLKSLSLEARRRITADVCLPDLGLDESVGAAVDQFQVIKP